MLKIYNTLSRKIETFKPILNNKVSFYSCGPTVYHFQHIGNLRTYVSNDLLKRVLMLNGYIVNHVMNITDVGHLVSNADTGEDKMEKGAKREGKSVWDVAKFYTEDFFDSLAKLNVIKAKVICKATDHIKEMVVLISKLEKNGFTYRINDGIYFDTSKLSDYGKLAKLDIKGLKKGARVEMVPGKKNNTDFALWKFSGVASHRQMEWDSPWGKGFPGWHIECSAMSMKYLGDTFDIHSGGIDHISIHHTNEIAQAEAATGKPFVKYWIHFAHLIINDEKMSKSIGNVYLKKDLEGKGFDLIDLRYLCLMTHYKTTMNFSWDALSGGHKALVRLREKISAWLVEYKPGKEIDNEKYFKIILDSFNNDLNIPQALATVWQMLDDQNVSDEVKLNIILKADEIFGLGLSKIKTIKAKIPDEILKLEKLRDKYRLQKNWLKSDEVRKEIEMRGFTVEDTKAGTVIASDQV